MGVIMSAIAPLVSPPGSRVDVPPVRTAGHTHRDKRVWEVIADFFKKTNNVPKLINYALQWAGRIVRLMGREMHPGLEKLGRAAGIYKLGFNTLRTPHSILETSDAVHDLRKTYWTPGATKDEKAFAVRKVVRKASDLSNDACDVASIGDLIFPNKYMPQIKVFGAVSTAIGAFSNWKDDSETMKLTRTREEKIVVGLARATSICYAFVGTLGIAFAATGSVVVGSLVLVPLTIAVICMTVSHFFANAKLKADPGDVLSGIKDRIHPLPARTAVAAA
jgi:hypothetical protein